MKIAIYANYLTRNKNTGVEVYAKKLIPGLLALGEHEIVLIHNEGDVSDLETYKCEKIRLKTKGKILPYLNGELKRVIKRENIDLFFNPGQYTYFSRTQNSIVTIHDIAWKYYPEYFPFLKKHLFNYMTRYALKRCDHVISVSHLTAKDCDTHYNVKMPKIHVVHHGFDNLEYSSTPGLGDHGVLSKYNLTEKYFLYLGTLQKRKNIIGMIKAFNKIDSEHSLVLAGGKGWYYEEIEKAIDSSPRKDKIKVLGYVDETDKAPLYRNAELFFLPSLYEGFGIPVLEAMACGTAVLTSYGSSMSEITGNDYPLLVNAHDFEDISNKIKSFLNMGEEYKKDLIRNNLHLAEKFSWDKTIRETNAIFNIMAGNRK